MSIILYIILKIETTSVIITGITNNIAIINPIVIIIFNNTTLSPFIYIIPNQNFIYPSRNQPTGVYKWNGGKW